MEYIIQHFLVKLRMRVLIIEDNRDLAANISQFLENLGHDIDYADNGTSGYQLASSNPYDALILDISLPGKNGIELCQELRHSAGIDVPVLMLTAMDTLDTKLKGFDAGADDYLVKPFSLRELSARLESIHRRHQGTVISQELRVHDLSYDPNTLEIHRADTLIDLKPTTKKLLVFLMRATNRVVNREEIEFEIWGNDPPDGDSLRAHIYSIRNAIDKPFKTKLLHTVHGVGYRLAVIDEQT